MRPAGWEAATSLTTAARAAGPMRRLISLPAPSPPIRRPHPLEAAADIPTHPRPALAAAPGPMQSQPQLQPAPLQPRAIYSPHLHIRQRTRPAEPAERERSRATVLLATAATAALVRPLLPPAAAEQNQSVLLRPPPAGPVEQAREPEITTATAAMPWPTPRPS